MPKKVNEKSSEEEPPIIKKKKGRPRKYPLPVPPAPVFASK